MMTIKGKTLTMKKVLVLNGSPRKNGNSVQMAGSFLNGAQNNTVEKEIVNTHDINLRFCKGCLRCNVLGKCSISDDDWPELSRKILEADVLVFSSPVYFHHVTAQMKRVLDRFRSFIHVELNENDLTHTPRNEWRKDFVLLLSMGSSDDRDADPVVELFHFLTSTLGQSNKLHLIKGTRLAVSNQVVKSLDELKIIYPKLNLPEDLAETDYKRNQEILKKCYQLGIDLTI